LKNHKKTKDQYHKIKTKKPTKDNEGKRMKHRRSIKNKNIVKRSTNPFSTCKYKFVKKCQKMSKTKIKLTIRTFSIYSTINSS